MKFADPFAGLIVTVKLLPLLLQLAPPLFWVTLTGIVKPTSSAMFPNHPAIRVKSASQPAITAFVRAGSGPPGLAGGPSESS